MAPRTPEEEMLDPETEPTYEELWERFSKRSVLAQLDSSSLSGGHARVVGRGSTQAYAASVLRPLVKRSAAAGSAAFVAAGVSMKGMMNICLSC